MNGSWNLRPQAGRRPHRQRRPPCGWSAQGIPSTRKCTHHLSHCTFCCPTNPLRLAARDPRERAIVNFPRLSTASRWALTTKLARESAGVSGGGGECSGGGTHRRGLQCPGSCRRRGGLVAGGALWRGGGGEWSAE